MTESDLQLAQREAQIAELPKLQSEPL
jgi:hypothetical protein